MKRVVDPLLPDDATVCEIGSRNFNGTARDALHNRRRTWVGLDRQEGPCVDVVGDAVDYLAPRVGQFDAIVASSAYEHDPTFWATNNAARWALKPGGHYIVTTPTLGFPYHDYGGDFYRFTEDAYRQVFFGGMHIVDICRQVPEPSSSLCGVAHNIRTPQKCPDRPMVYGYTLVSARWRPWLRHWITLHADRCDALYVLVIDGDPGCIADCLKWGAVPITRASGAPDGLWDWYRQVWQHAAGHNRGNGRWDWYLCTDVDEVFDCRYDIRELVKDVASAGNVYCWAEMLSQVAETGKAIPLPGPEVPSSLLLDWFPVDVRMHKLLRGGNPTKPVLRRCDMTGLHDLEHKPSRRWADSRLFALHHFDFCAEAEAVVARKIEINRGEPLAKEYLALARALHTGIDLSSAPRRLPDGRLFRERTPDLQAF